MCICLYSTIRLSLPVSVAYYENVYMCQYFVPKLDFRPLTSAVTLHNPHNILFYRVIHSNRRRSIDTKVIAKALAAHLAGPPKLSSRQMRSIRCFWAPDPDVLILIHQSSERASCDERNGIRHNLTSQDKGSCRDFSWQRLYAEYRQFPRHTHCLS